MQNISFDDGYKSYMINNDENKVIRVNISDLNIKKRLEETHDKLFGEIDKAKDEGATTEVITRIDNTIRETLNYVFGSDICTAAFGSANVLSPTTSGKLLIEGFLDAFLPMITEDIKSITIEHKKDVEDKTAKYIVPVLSKPTLTGIEAQPIDVDSMTTEQKNALLQKLLK